MKKIFFFFLWFCLLSSFVFGQEAKDTLELHQLVSIWDGMAKPADIKTSEIFFVISKTKVNPRFNYGLFWPDGSLVKLPVRYIPGTVEIERTKNGSYILTWFEKKGEKGEEYNLFFSLLPELKVSELPVPVLVEIRGYL